jgi:hypothetical protein
MKSLWTLLLPVLLCTGQLAAQVGPATQAVNCNGTATINVSVSGALYYATVTGGLVITDNGVDKTLLVTTQSSFTVRAASGGGQVHIALASNPDVVVGTAQVTVTPMAVGNITGPSISGGVSCISANGTATYSIPAISGASYIWRVVHGGQHTRILSGGNTNTVTIESINEGNSALYVYVYNDCTGDICAAAVRGVEIKKIFSLDANETFGGPACLDASVLGQDSILVYSVKPYLGLHNTGNDYAWTLSAGLELVYKSADGSSLTLKVNDATVDQQVSISVGPACNGSSNTLTKILKAPAPAPTFEAPSFCVSDVIGTQATFSVTNNPLGQYSYQWILPENWSIVSSNGPNNTQVTIQFNNSGTGNITVAASNQGCGTKFSTITVNRYPAVASPIAGLTCVPFGNTTPITYSVQGGGSNTYKWEVIPASAGWTVTTGNGSAIDIIPAFGNIPASGEVEIRATIEGNCGTAPVTSSLMVDVGPSNPSAIGGTACVPYGTTSLTYSIADVPRASGYQWTIPPGWTVNGNTTGTSVSVNPNNTNGTLKVVALGCSAGSNSGETSLAVTMGPALPAAIAGPACVAYNSTSLTYSIDPVTNATGYQWEIPAGWIGATSSDNRSITISNMVTAGGEVRVKALGCSAGANSEFKVLNVAVGPQQPGLITGLDCVTPSGGNQVYSVAAVTNATGYTWSFPTGWTIQAGANTNSVTVTPGTTGGPVSVTALGCGSGSNSAPQTMTVNTAPAQPGPITYYVGSPGITCIGQGAGQVVTFSIDPVAGASSYTWTFPWTAGSTTTTATTVNAVTDASSGGTVTVVANGAVAGCNSTARTLSVVRAGLDFCVLVERVTSTFRSYTVDDANILNGTPVNYSWFNGNSAIPSLQGPAETSFAAHNNVGSVRVDITDGNGCVTSLTIPTTTAFNTYVCTPGGVPPGLMAQPQSIAGRMADTGETFVSTEEVSETLELFPNPAVDEVKIRLPRKMQQAELVICSVQGKLVESRSIDDKKVTVNVSGYQNGAYLIVIRGSSASGSYSSYYGKFIVKH